MLKFLLQRWSAGFRIWRQETARASHLSLAARAHRAHRRSSICSSAHRIIWIHSTDAPKTKPRRIKCPLHSIWHAIYTHKQAIRRIIAFTVLKRDRQEERDTRKTAQKKLGKKSAPSQKPRPQLEVVVQIPLPELHSFPDHSFQVREDASMLGTAGSVKEHSALVPRWHNRRKTVAIIADCRSTPQTHL